MGIMTINSDLNQIGTIIKDTIAKVRQENAAQNKRNRDKIVDFYHNRQNTEEYLNQYGFKEQDEFPLSTINLTRKIIDKISLIYKTPPDRYLYKGNEKLDKDIGKYQDFLNEHSEINLGFMTVERMKNALHNVLFRPMWMNGKWNPWIETEWTPIFIEGDPLTPVAYLIPVKRDVYETSSQSVEEKDWFMFWSKDEYFWIDDDGNKKFVEPFTDGVNRFGRLPFVELRKEIAVDDYWPQGAIDLVEMNQQINVLINDLNLSIRFQAYDQPWIKSIDKKDAVNFKVGPHRVWYAEDDMGEFGTLGFNPKITETMETIRSLIQLIGWTYNVHIDWSMQGSPASGFSLLIQNIDLLEARQDDVDICKIYEKEIYEVIQIQTEILDTDTNTLPKLDKEVRLIVDFDEIDFPINEQEKREADDWDISHNIKSEIDLIQERNPDMDVEEAILKWEDNKKFNSKYSSRQKALADKLKEEDVTVEPEGEE